MRCAGDALGGSVGIRTFCRAMLTPQVIRVRRVLYLSVEGDKTCLICLGGSTSTQRISIGNKVAPLFSNLTAK